MCFLIALSRIGELWQCFGGGWGRLQNPKHGLKTSDTTTKSKTWVKKRGAWWTPQIGAVWDFVEAFAGLEPLFGIS